MVPAPLAPIGGEGVERQLKIDGWQQAWHGTKMEALYCIACCGRLFESSDEQRGERLFAGAVGVYLRED